MPLITCPSSCDTVLSMALSLQYDEAKLIADYFSRVPRPSGTAGVMIDVGAQFGTSFRPYLQQGWRCVAFEPDSTKLPKLQQFLSNPQLTLIRAAVGEKPAKSMQFYTSAESTGISSLVPFRDSHTPSESVPVTTLSIELPEFGIEHIDYLKIDTEGYDLFVLRGHDWRIKPEVVMAEFDELKTRHVGTSYHDIAKLLVDQGYIVYCSEWQPLVKYGSGHTWHAMQQYPCALHHPDAWGNFIAIRGDADLNAMAELIAPHRA